MKSNEQAVNAHYSQEGLGATILEALRNAGKDVNALTPDDLAPIEEFHIGGRQPTLDLGRLAGLSEGTKVVDVGCGIGGPARALAHYFGCDVTGVDLTEEFCAAAVLLNECTGLGHKVTIKHGSALALPLEDASVDVTWMQHVGMNIEDKAGLLKELGRVLRPEGKFAFYEVFAGPEPEVHFPLPFAGGPDLSFLVSQEEAKGLCEAAGFRAEAWSDVTEQAAGLLRAAFEKAMAAGPALLSPGLLMGPEYPIKVGNVLRNLEENRLRVVQAVLTLRS